ncbi:chromate efflux transporter [Oricola cellulosilytica]|uniref:Chromate efflux transporter n=1 Tax=Oricola cellulosilytica TaxID=1429082 RepID=A0A4R0PCX9_9HYPH|nr:chromate efflux transporter [Oricola cellulosilytica]TCD15331.1 chromate efflux transporter [Oricola cellulosilytica]
MADLATESEPVPPDVEPIGEVFKTFLRIGMLSFGGPAAQIAVMHRILVEEKRWLSETRFLHALNFCMLLPGPEAMQLATYSGWLMHGVRGGLIAGLLFILPGLAMMLVLSAIYVLYGELPAVAGLLYGLKAAVLAVVAAALVEVARKALKSPFMLAVAITAFAAIAFLNAPFPLIVIGAGVFGGLTARIAPQWLGFDPMNATSEPLRKRRSGSHAATLMTVAVWLTIWLAPLAFFIVGFGPGHVFADAALFFSKTAVVTFGGAYAVLSYVGQQAVELYGWLRPEEMLAGLGLAETTLGPLVLVLVFVGFLGGSRVEGWDPLSGGLAGGLIAAFFTFVPCFLWIFAGAPYVEALRNVRWLSAGLQTITAAVVGVIANLALWFALHVLFGAYGEVRLGALVLPDPEWSAIDPFAAAIAICAGIALIGFRLNMIVVLIVAAAAGLLPALV